MPDGNQHPADPLLLLPLRLEYRVVDRVVEGDVPVTLGSIPDDARRDASRDTASGPTTVSAVGEKSELRFQKTTPEQREIWFRWLPDEPFALEGVEAPSAEEQAALATFLATVDEADADWFDADNPTVAGAWQAYASAVGVYRGVHLVRGGGSVVDDLETAMGRLVGLPDHVSLFALSGTSLTPLGSGEPIQHELRYTPAALGAGDWLTSFPDAISAGMGMKLTDPDQVSAALDAHWVIAVGIRDGDATEVVESYLSDAIANGNFELLEQDTPTNNSDDARTRYEVVPRDAIAALRLATYAEQRTESDPPTDAHLLAAALGVDVEAILQAPGAVHDGVGHARSMATALLPGLVDILSSWISDARVPRDSLIEFLVEHASARGPLPAIRLDQQPFGVLPIVDPDRVGPPEGMNEAQQRVFELVHRLGSTAVQALGNVASQQPVIEPGAADNADRFERILRLNAVGKRIDVMDVAAQDPKRRRLRCPLVEGPEHSPSDYIGQIQTTPLAELPDPDQRDQGNQATPLLYRLLRLSLERATARLPVSLRDLPLTAMAEQAEQASPATKARLDHYVAALEQLKDLPRDQLETLMLEVIDLLHHRHDASLTAIAASRLSAHRRDRPVGLQLGYYGFLGKLRPESVTVSSDGYIQTPNLDKAITAGLLRSAAQRYGETSTFNMDLSSRRLRRALAAIDLLREGLSPREVLGYRAERWLHDQRHDILIHELRARFPLRQGEGTTAEQERLMDGLALAESGDGDLGGLTASHTAVVQRLRTQLADDLDAISDLTVAEAVHQMALGNNGAANAWINVLSGEPVPSTTTFISTRRDGHGSTHRFSLVLDPRTMPGDNPRDLVEPAVGRFAGRLLRDFGSCSVRVSVPKADGDAEPLILDLRLRADLGMTAVDLVVGGRNEIMLRARHHAVRLWRTRTSLQAELGSLPTADLVTHINQVQPISVDLAHGTPSADDLLRIAQRAGLLIREGRPLEPTDLNAAMPPEERLTEPEIVDMHIGTIGLLVARAEKLSNQLTALVDELNHTLDDVHVAAAELERLRDAGAPAAQIDAQRQHLVDERETLEASLLQSSRFGLPEALLPFAAEELETGGAANEHLRRIESISGQLADKRAELDDALVLAATAPTTQRQAEQLRFQLVVALQAACDGEGLPVLPPFRKQAKTTPTLDDVPNLGSEVQPHEAIRPKLRTIRWLAHHDPDQRAWRSTETATADIDEDDPQDTVRSEEERPRSHHFGIYLGLQDGILGTGSNTLYSGIVIEEWSELRPSMIQTTGMAINYDAPQSEPPHCLLLGVAPDASHTEWTPESAAVLVQEAIRLMQTRALPSALASRREYFGTLFNVVRPAGSGRRRLPTSNYSKLHPLLDELAGRIEVIDTVPSLARSVRALDERRYGDHDT
jgi:hypothetical protein